MLTIKRYVDGIAFYRDKEQTYNNEIMFYSWILDKFRYKDEVSFMDNLMAITVAKYYRQYNKKKEI